MVVKEKKCRQGKEMLTRQGGVGKVWARPERETYGKGVSCSGPLCTKSARG